MFATILARLNPYLFYIKLGIIAALVVAAASGAWYVRSAIAYKDKDKAVSKATAQLYARLDEERAARAAAETVANARAKELLKTITKLEVEKSALAKAITAERASNKKFYQQPLPQGGYEQWKRARSLVGPSPASSPSP